MPHVPFLFASCAFYPSGPPLTPTHANPRELAAMAASGNNDNHMVDNHIGDYPLLHADILWAVWIGCPWHDE